MRRKLAELTRKEFDKRMKERLPQFSEEKHGDTVPGSRVYCWNMKVSFRSYIYLTFAPLEDRFNIDIAWSLNERFPSGVLPTGPYEQPKNGDKRFRLSELWGETKDPWWWVAEKPNWQAVIESGNPLEDPPLEECMPKVKPAVEDAVGRIVEFAIPYFGEVISKYS